ncbi:MAG: mandelate racemase/muconate lactonizing enzyme family protein [Betaproteobacteria bacterium]|nr:mandelate racemase/muconate lactonizing enzyme family protein [Betaproteobacteria bacterium]
MATVRSIEALAVSLPRATPYLGPLAEGERVNARGYVVRKGNRTIYPTADRSVIVKATASDGTVGWGETYGIVAPLATLAILRDVLAPVVEGRDPRDAMAIWQDLYDLMRVRGGASGFYGDALAGVDIALCDLAARIEGVPLAQWLGGARRERIPAYVSGLPKATLSERVAFAREWAAKGFDAFKYAAVVSHEGVVEEMQALRAALPRASLMVDLHWKYTAAEALALAHELAPYEPAFVEAPVAPEDIAGLAEVAAGSPVPVAAGEEWHNVYEAGWRLPLAKLAYVQPEIAHTGATQFLAIARHARQCGARIAPHATIGVGIFMAASLHASAALDDCAWHEYQHSVFDGNLAHVDTAMRCEAGFYTLPRGPGLGAVPRESLWAYRMDL